MKVELINDQQKVKLDLELIKKVSKYVSGKFDKDATSQLNIIFSDKKKIRELNKKYRNVDSETDVLSFSYISDKESISPETGACTVIIGEIFICPEVAESNVLGQGKDWDLNLEIITLVVHSILHVYNYDHAGEKDRVNMEGIQNSLISDVRRTFGL